MLYYSKDCWHNIYTRPPLRNPSPNVFPGNGRLATHTPAAPRAPSATASCWLLAACCRWPNPQLNWTQIENKIRPVTHLTALFTVRQQLVDIFPVLRLETFYENKILNIQLVAWYYSQPIKYVFFHSCIYLKFVLALAGDVFWYLLSSIVLGPAPAVSPPLEQESNSQHNI